MRVLIVEDEKNIALEISEFLNKSSYTTELARRKSSAEEKIFVNQYDLFYSI